MSSSLDTLIDTCKRYKAGTAKFLKWLSDESARAHGESQQTTAHAATLKPQPKVKNIPVDELKGMATAIVQADSKIAIPLEMLYVASDVINGRRWCCDWYSCLRPHQRDAKKHAESNSRHRYFLKALEETLAILKQEAKKRQPKRKKTIKLPAADSSEADLGSLFLHLDLEDVSDDLLTSSTTLPLSEISGNAREVPPTDETIITLEGDEVFTTLFEIWGLLKDFNGLREQAAIARKQLVAGEPSSMLAACQLHEHAVQLSIVVATEFHEAHPDLPSFTDIVDCLGEDLFTMSSFSTQSAHDNDAGLTLDREVLCIPAWNLLQDVNRLAREMKSTKHSHRAQQSEVFSNHPFGKALLSIVKTFVGFLAPNGRGVQNPIAGFLSFADEYTQQLGRFIATPHWNAGFVAATQLYMDFYDFLEGDLARGVRDYEPILDQIETKAIDYIAWYDQLDEPTKINTPDTAPYTMQMICCIARPHCYDQARREGWNLQQNLSANSDQLEAFFMPLSVLNTLPILAGHLTWKLRLIAHRNEIALCNSRGVVLAAAHIHNATKLLHGTSYDWPDLDHVVSRQSTAFLRHGNGSVLSAARQYAMALGHPLEVVTGSHRPKIPSVEVISNKGVVLQSASYFSAHDTGTLVLRDRSLPMKVMYDAVRGYATAHCGIKDKVIAEQWSNTKRLTPGQILLVLGEIIFEDERQLQFDYLGLLRVCVDTLRDVGKACSLKQRAMLQSRKAVGNFMFEQVYEILYDAAAIETRGLPVERSPLFTARQGIRAALEKKVGDRIDGS
ncbi:uncharacterized protein RCC_05070 [Ramularia collo-cygni]|uniref:DUF6604 domain-containing protein n=1 Tax=Ramularia collo-cygni TaxID=112498 RepID=A0A2D3V9C1_9PEZI|nr:uncharacterized protein RCC_05070 [Ramularia collo-cygni]CZT19224.1 uncharacterized protein RCC_05070 [Ramularia collo-cygni]